MYLNFTKDILPSFNVLEVKTLVINLMYFSCRIHHSFVLINLYITIRIFTGKIIKVHIFQDIRYTYKYNKT